MTRQVLKTVNWPIILFIFPVVAYIRALGELMYYGGSSMPLDTDLGRAMLFLYIFGTVTLVLGVLLNSWRMDVGVGARLCADSDQQRQKRKAVLASRQSSETHIPVPPDVAAEARRIHEQQSIVTIRDVHQLFGDSTHAVRGVSLGIDQDTCFGLLGVNGAGKTTVLNMLTGLLRPTAGEMIVAGMDLERDLNQVQTVVGVCPQHDIFFPDLSVSDHLHFFARTRGFVRSQEPAVVQWLAASVGLAGDALWMKAGTLSGTACVVTFGSFLSLVVQVDSAVDSQ